MYSIVELLLNVIVSKPGVRPLKWHDDSLNGSLQEHALYNTISAIFAISKLPKCRDLLTTAPISVESHIIALSNSESSKIKHNCARVLKNLTADSAEAIEEGTVATLIALSLEV